MILYIFISLVIVSALWWYGDSSSRAAIEVMDGLIEGQEGPLRDEQELRRIKGLELEKKDDLARAGIYSIEGRRRYNMILQAFPFVGLVLGILGCLLFQSFRVGNLFFCSLLGLALGYLLSRARIRGDIDRYRRRVEFFLPVVVERILMAIQAGHHVVSAINKILELERRQIGSDRRLDPVTELLELAQRLTAAGLPFEKSLQVISKVTDVSAARHAFLHLGVAHSQGGDLVVPLKELSESTQAYFQESVEEQIAKLPVKATLPLLCTFAGMVILFITPQVLQIVAVTKKVSASATAAP